jgi:hypothetical protein
LKAGNPARVNNMRTNRVYRQGKYLFGNEGREHHADIPGQAGVVGGDVVRRVAAAEGVTAAANLISCELGLRTWK